MQKQQTATSRMKNNTQAPFPLPAEPLSSDLTIDPARVVQQVLAALEPLPGKQITYTKIETALEAAGLDPYEHSDCYQTIIDEVERQGALVVDSIQPIAAPIDHELLSLLEADEVEQLLKSILTDNEDNSKQLLTPEEERRLLEIYADGRRAGGELQYTESDFHSHQVQRRIRAGNLARDELVRRNLRLVAANVIKYGKGVRQLAFEDLLQEGAIGLSHAIERFDLDLNMRLSTYATWWIRQAITRAMADQDRTIRLPVHMVEKILRLRRIERELEMALGRSPTEDEIALELGDISPNDCQTIRSCWESGRPLPDAMASLLERAIRILHKLQQAATIEPLSLDLPVNGTESSTLGEFIPCKAAEDPESQSLRVDLGLSINEVTADLSQRTRWVLRQRFGLDDGQPRTLEYIGQQLNITRERVRQIEAKALRMLKHPLRARKLRDSLEP